MYIFVTFSVIAFISVVATALLKQQKGWTLILDGIIIAQSGVGLTWVVGTYTIESQRGGTYLGVGNYTRVVQNGGWGHLPGGEHLCRIVWYKHIYNYT